MRGALHESVDQLVSLRFDLGAGRRWPRLASRTGHHLREEVTDESTRAKDEERRKIK